MRSLSPFFVTSIRLTRTKPTGDEVLFNVTISRRPNSNSSLYPSKLTLHQTSHYLETWGESFTRSPSEAWSLSHPSTSHIHMSLSAGPNPMLRTPSVEELEARKEREKVEDWKEFQGGECGGGSRFMRATRIGRFGQTRGSVHDLSYDESKDTQTVLINATVWVPPRLRPLRRCESGSVLKSTVHI